MKQILLICAVVALVGCGKKTEPKQQAEANATVTLKPESPKVAPEKAITNPIIEKEIRRQLKKPTGELTKADLGKVTDLGLRENQLTDVKELEKLTQLRELSLADNQLTDLTDLKGLEKLTQLTWLSLHDNQLTEVPKELEKLTQLELLELGNNKLTDVTGLEKLTKLEVLSLSDNKLTDVKGLEKLTKLELLYLENNPDLTKAQIDELQKAFPKCKIHSNATK